MKKFEYTKKEIDDLVLGWLNRLPAVEIDRFFWDYPGPSGYSETGYGLGITTARRIVRARSRKPGGLTSMKEVASIPGIGPDKINDMQMQAKEALALADYHGVSHDPIKLRDLLTNEGPGVPLSSIIEKLKRVLKTADNYITRVIQCKAMGTILKIPFVVLACVNNDKRKIRKSASQFTRIRIQPWAFKVFTPDYYRYLLIEQGLDNEYQTCVKEYVTNA